MKRPLLLAALLVAPAIPFPVRAEPLAEDQLKTADHDSLGKAISTYFAARNKNQGIDKAQEEVAGELDKFKKRLKGRDPLSLTGDLGKALWESFSYETQKGIKKGKISTATVAAPYLGEKKTLEYAVSVPSKYDPKHPYPVLLCIPEQGAKPQEHLTDKWISPDVREGAILVAVPMPEDSAAWLETGGEEKPGGIGNTLTVMREILRLYAVDYDRLYLCGRGEGVPVAMVIGERLPDRFAGVIGRAGDVGETPADNFRNLPTFFAGAGAGATAFLERVDKLAYGNCTVKPEADEAELWAWIQQHARVSYPPEVVLVPGPSGPFRAYWLATPRSDAKSRLVAKVDRATNMVTVEGEGASSVILYFNDVLLDLDKPVKVVCNGSEHVDLVPRNLASTLVMLYEAPSDPGKLFTAQKSYDLPAKSKPK
jgi:hypothetical protein